MNSRDVQACVSAIGQASRIVALTGAGISTAAGIPDFRGPAGLYVTRRYDPEKVFEIDAFHRDPLPFYDFTRDFLALLETVQPTFTHRFLAALEKDGKLSALITQNIDALHNRAGSRNVIAVHGDYWTSHCLACGKEFHLDQMREMVRSVPVPHCPCNGLIKPDVVFFGEQVRELNRAQAAVSACDLLLILGSSLTVYPAAALPSYAPGEVIMVNKGHTFPTARRHWQIIEADLDTFFRAADKELQMPE